MSNSTIDNLLEKLHAVQSEVEHEIDMLLQAKREQFQYRVEKGKVRFERRVKQLQKKYKTGIWSYLTHSHVSHILSAPVIYSLIVPFMLLDLSVNMYQQICFRLYGIPLVKRKNYIVIDRHNLAYLNTIEKINCIYCGYGNGLIGFTREVAARTEQYWCPIKHHRRTLDPHRHSEHFIDYGDADRYNVRMEELREEIKKIKT
jgi:hypothetical protein